MRGHVAVVLLACLLVAVPASATHDDGTFDQPISFRWDTTHLDVVVVPPQGRAVCPLDGLQPPADPVAFVQCTVAELDPGEVDPTNNTYLRAVHGSIDAWNRGIETFASPWLKEGLTLDIYTVGVDVVPPDAATDPEILVTAEYGFFAAHTTVGDLPVVCLSTASGPGGVWNYSHVYNLNAHEYGHCLGQDHTGTGGQGAVEHPRTDIMSYGEPVAPLKCPSNLNARALENVYAPLLRRQANETAHVPVGDYVQLDCNDRVPGDLVRLVNATEYRPVDGNGSETPPGSTGSEAAATVPGAGAVGLVVAAAVAAVLGRQE